MTMKALMKDPLNLVITGVGGQGNVVISLLIGNALIGEGYKVTVGETYGASQRSGSVMSHVRISREIQYFPVMPNGCADIVLGMEPVETLRRLVQFGNPNVVTIVNPRPMYPVSVSAGEVEYPDIGKLIHKIEELSARVWVINATEEAQKLGDPVFANMILIGALIGSGLLPLDTKSVEPALQERFPKRLQANMIALKKGLALISE